MYDLFYIPQIRPSINTFIQLFLGYLNDGNEIVKSEITYLNIHVIDVLSFELRLCVFFFLLLHIDFRSNSKYPFLFIYYLPSTEWFARKLFSIHKSRCAFDHPLSVWRTSRKSPILHTQWSRTVRRLVAISREAEAGGALLWCLIFLLFFWACISL